ncbi:WecB/TagA/CpsF family glycosyltransferase [Magnetospirillum fulvum]|uniref:Polymer biosynthesis protein, WecB/TagA/CpsF family n=1 Tax=Magnetospirillum fulvum TaxID=1082 RepID=A0A1H6HB11_MAGFU|nr:WecB/TagA/CpsF family glycosyltransferase [Magnetospirillum fulvum]SEH32676.1 polymer biosynthesis protein, WecB/TagA/CpsF family [Magnetospirillum fulvum]
MSNSLFNLLNHLSILHSESEKTVFLEGLRELDRPVVISFLNAHAFNLAARDAVFRTHLMHADILFRDGIGSALLLKLQGENAGINLNGTDLIPEILRALPGQPVALCGTREPWLSRAAEVIEAAGNPVVLRLDGFQDRTESLEALAHSHAAIFILAMGMPHQEALAAQLAVRLSGPAVILNGGAILDFMALRFPRAPHALRRLHLEWLFRLLQEPSRMWQRYLLGGVAFVWRALWFRVFHGPLRKGD